MELKTKIQQFISQPSFALVGVSREKNKFGNIVYRTLKDKGFNVFPINPNVDSVNGDKCYSNISSLPEEVKAIVILTNKKNTDHLVDEAIVKGIKHIWIQQTSNTAHTKELSSREDLCLIDGKCILMHANASGFHAFHKWLVELFGKTNG